MDEYRCGTGVKMTKLEPGVLGDKWTKRSDSKYTKYGKQNLNNVIDHHSIPLYYVTETNRLMTPQSFVFFLCQNNSVTFLKEEPLFKQP